MGNYKHYRVCPLNKFLPVVVIRDTYPSVIDVAPTEEIEEGKIRQTRWPGLASLLLWKLNV
jgi:hypothetical protein